MAILGSTLSLATPLAAQTFEVSPPAAEAARLFQKVCVAHRTRLSGSEDTLATLDFIHETESDDIWFHPTYDLSFSIRTGDGGGYYCSMVWSSRDPLSDNIGAIAAVAPDADRPEFFNTDLMRTRIDGTY